MDILAGLTGYVLPFLVILTMLVFVHELGHYLVARRNGVRVEVFSIGFGPELFGYTAPSGTRWRFSAIPLGGYVRMLGDADPAGMRTEDLPEAERNDSLPSKSLGQKAAIVAAGPIANFLFAIVLFAGIFMFVGQPYTPPVVGGVLPESAAEEAGFQAGDRIVEVGGAPIDRFERLQQVVMLNTGTPVDVVVDRGGTPVTLTVTPDIVQETDGRGRTILLPRLGLQSQGFEFRKFGPVEAVGQAFKETYNFSAGTLTALGQMITGARGTEDIGGMLRIADASGQAAEAGIVPFVWFAAILSVNLGLLNLMPVPLLDGGHLVFYAVEAVRRRPLGPRAQEYGFRLGFALVLTLLVVATWNDLVHLRIVDFFRQLVS